MECDLLSVVCLDLIVEARQNEDRPEAFVPQMSPHDFLGDLMGELNNYRSVCCHELKEIEDGVCRKQLDTSEKCGLSVGVSPDL